MLLLVILVILTLAGLNPVRSGCILSNDFEEYDFAIRRCRYRFIGDDYRFTCEDSRDTLQCSNTTLDEIIKEVSESSSTQLKVIVSSSSISELTGNDFIGSNVTEFKLDSVGLEWIDRDFFKTFEQLKILEITNNNLTNLDGATFHPLKRLERLHLTNNSIQNVDSQIFDGLRNLGDLVLSNNQLTTVPNNIISHQIRGDRLDLSYNNLREIEFGFNFIQLNLKHNRFERFNFSKSSKSITDIFDLSENDIVEVIGLNSSSTAESIDLSNNKIKSLSTTGQVLSLNLSRNRLEEIGDYFAQSYVRALDLSYNNIAKISPSAFTHSRGLFNLYLNNNKLKDLPTGCFSSLKSLETLNLAHNSIHTIQFGLLTAITELHSLDLSHNGLDLDFHTMLTLNQLNTLRISGNRISNLDEKFLIEHFPNLKFISIDNHAWDCARLAKMIHRLQKSEVAVSRGHTLNSSNVMGISCEDNSENGNEEIYFKRTPLNESPKHVELSSTYHNLYVHIVKLMDSVKNLTSQTSAYLQRFSDNYREGNNQQSSYLGSINATQIFCNIFLALICACLIYSLYLRRRYVPRAHDTPLL